MPACTDFGTGEIVERQQGILIFRQAVDRFGIFRVIFFDAC